MTLLELVAKITLDSKEYKSGLKSLQKETKEKANGIKKGMLTATGVMAGALAAVGVSAVKTGAEFDKAMSQVAATMGTTTDEIQNLRDFAKEMGSTTQFSATQAAEALNYMALAGYDAETSMKMLPNVLNLASAGTMDLATASDMVTDAQSALGLRLDETTDLVDKMAQTASKSNTSVSQLGEAMLTIGGTAKALSGGTTELSAALGILADNGIKGAEGGTALRNVLLGIQGDKFDKTFGELGVSAYDAQGNLRPLKDILADMDSVMEGMTSQEKTQLINKTFNRQDLKTVNALLGTTTDRWDELTNSIDNAQGAAQKMADTQLDNLTGDVTKLKSAWEGFQINLSEKLTPALRVVTQLLTKLIDNMDIAGPIILGVATAFTVLAVAINMKKIITSVTTSFTALNAVLAANPIGIVIALISGLVIAIATLWASNEDFRNFVIETWEKIKEVFGAFAEWVGGIIDTIKEWFNGLKESIAETWDNIKNKIEEVWDSILNNPIVQAIIEYFTSTFENFKNTLAGIWDGIKEYAGGVWDLIKNVILAPVLLLIDLVTGNFDKLKEDATNIWENIKDAASRIWEGIKKIFGSIVEGIVNQVKLKFETMKKVVTTIFTSVRDKVVEIWTNIKNKVVEFATNLVNGIKEKITKVPKIIKEKFTEAVNFIKELPKKALTWGKDMIQNFINGIKEKFNALGNVLSDVGNKIRDFLGFSEPEKGPLSNFHTFAPDMMDLFMQGIKDNEKKLQDTVADAFNFKDLIVPGEVNINGKSSNPTNSAIGSKSVVINVYGAPGQDVNELANIVSKKLDDALRREQEAWA